jgi:hypothetical protein
MSCQFPAICKVVARPVRKHLFPVNAVRRLRAVFGGIPRLLPSGVLVLSAYATKIGRSLLLAAEPWHTSRELLERLQAQCPGVYPKGQLRTLQRRLKEWRREVAHRMVFGTMTVDPGNASGDSEARLLSNGANDHFSDRQGGAKSPVDLPLRLDDAAASPTTPQGQHQ